MTSHECRKKIPTANHLWGESTGVCGFPAQGVSNTEITSITSYSLFRLTPRETPTLLISVKRSHQWLMGSPHRGPAVWKTFVLKDVFMNVADHNNDGFSKVKPEFVQKVSMNNKSSVVHVMACHRSGDKSSHVSILTNLKGSRPQCKPWQCHT